MIDTKKSFRKGSIIVEIHVDEKGTIVRSPTDFGSINKAKKANRVTKYRTIPHQQARRKLNGVWVS